MFTDPIDYARGEPRYRIRSCEGISVTNLAYGGTGNRSLFITESDTGTILRAEVPVAGHLMYSHRYVETAARPPDIRLERSLPHEMQGVIATQSSKLRLTSGAGTGITAA